MRSVRNGPNGLGVLSLFLVVTATLLPNMGCGVIPAVSAGEVTGPAAGDVNGDGTLDQADLDLATAAFGSTQGDPLFEPAADLNGDGVIGIDDLQVLVGILDAQGTTTGS